MSAQYQYINAKGRAKSAIPEYLDLLAQRYGTPLLVFDSDIVRQQYRALKNALPDVTPYYAIKALPYAPALDTLNREGASFDIASCGEIEMADRLGITARQCIHTHPVKKPGEVRKALKWGCSQFVFDNSHELSKLSCFRDKMKLLLRVGFSNPDSKVNLSYKFGCAVEDALPLLEQARTLGLQVNGLSFHVGSQVTDPFWYVTAVRTCAEIWKQALSRKLADLEVLDIGGGFPIDYLAPVTGIDEFCRPVRKALNEFPEATFISEPGRFLVAPAMYSVSSVTGIARREGRPWYYLDDGLYGSFSGQLFDKVEYPLAISISRLLQPREPSVLTGPTCDSIDIISDGISLPPLEEGDLVIAGTMGAYSWAHATEFNHIPRTRIVVVNNVQALSLTGTDNQFGIAADQ